MKESEGLRSDDSFQSDKDTKKGSKKGKSSKLKKNKTTIKEKKKDKDIPEREIKVDNPHNPQNKQQVISYSHQAGERDQQKIETCYLCNR